MSKEKKNPEINENTVNVDLKNKNDKKKRRAKRKEELFLE